MRPPPKCNWCETEILKSSIIENQQSYCCLLCKHYHTIDNVVTRLLSMAKNHELHGIVDVECNKLFDLLFNNDVCMYKHRRDDIGFELTWLYDTMSLSDRNLVNFPAFEETCQHLETLLDFLRTTTT